MVAPLFVALALIPAAQAALLRPAALFRPAAPQPAPDLPLLPWQVRSDWQLVTSFGAKGDGKADDTAALQAGLNYIAASRDNAAANKTLFFPPGTCKFRREHPAYQKSCPSTHTHKPKPYHPLNPKQTDLLTSALLVNYTEGVLLLGAGSATTLLWGGASGNASRMLWSDGNTRFHIEGFVFDGNGSEVVGLDHDSKNQYESRVVHRNLAFLRCSIGIRVGHAELTASAEMAYENLLFAYNWVGADIGQSGSWNDFDNYFHGCHFQDNAYGINLHSGNFYCSNTRFERSAVGDVHSSILPSSLRRIVSVGSASFITGLPEGNTSPWKIQSVFVTGWGVPRNASLPHCTPVPAMVIAGTGPIQITDSVFESPLCGNSSLLLMSSNPENGSHNAVLRSNVTSYNCTCKDAPNGPTRWECPCAFDGGYVPSGDSYFNNATYFDLPLGDPAIAAALPALSESTHFFQSTWAMPGRIFDAVADFGASSTGKESSAALQACLDAAAAAGAGAMCYLPAGQYGINTTLRLCGGVGNGGFSVSGGGGGFTTLLQWVGAAPPLNASFPPAVMLATGVVCASGVNASIEKLNVFTNEKFVLDFVASRTAAVPASPVGRHGALTLAPATGSAGQGGRILLRFDSFYFQSSGGAVLNALAAGDVVFGPLMDGNLEVMDSEAAVVLGSFYAIGNNGVVVARISSSGSGSSSGILGFVAMVAASTEYDVYLFNSSSITAADFYTETSHSCLYAEGAPADAPGVASLSFAKLNTNPPPWLAGVVSGYSGLVSISGFNEAYQTLNVSITGAAAKVVIAAGSIWDAQGQRIQADVSGGAELSIFAINDGWGLPNFNTTMHSDTFELAVKALDQQRRVCTFDALLNCECSVELPPSPIKSVTPLPSPCRTFHRPMDPGCGLARRAQVNPRSTSTTWGGRGAADFLG